MGKTTKTAMVKKHLIEKGSITSWDAIKLYGETRLSAIIFNLRKAGLDIITSDIESVDRYGNTSRYAKYFLVKGENT